MAKKLYLVILEYSPASGTALVLQERDSEKLNLLPKANAKNQKIQQIVNMLKYNNTKQK